MIILAAQGNGGLPVWSLTLFMVLISFLVGIIGWFVRREIQNLDKDLQKIRNTLYGSTDDLGKRTLGVLDHVDNVKTSLEDFQKCLTKYQESVLLYQENMENKYNSLKGWAKEMNQRIEEQVSHSAKIERRVEASETWVLEEGEKNRAMLEGVKKEQAETSKHLSSIDGKLEAILRLIKTS